MVDLTPQQRKFLRPSFLDLLDALVGDNRIFSLIKWELYENLIKKIAGVSGIMARRLYLKTLLRQCGRSVTCEEGVTFLGCRRISLGSHVIIRKACSLETRFGGYIKVGDYCLINQFSVISAKSGLIELGNGVNISSHCRIASNSNIKIGNSVLIAAHCYIGAPNHSLNGPEETITKEVETKGITIGDRVWIGANTVILDGVSIGENAIIGANSFVNSDIPPNCIAFGTPARVARTR